MKNLEIFTSSIFIQDKSSLRIYNKIPIQFPVYKILQKKIKQIYVAMISRISNYIKKNNLDTTILIL